LLGERDGGAEQGRRGVGAQAGPAGPLGHRAHLFDVGPELAPLFEEGLHVGVLPDGQARACAEREKHEGRSEPGPEAPVHPHGQS